MIRVFMKWMVVIPWLALLALGICDKPIFEKPLKDAPPLVLATSIEDSLPSATLKALNLKNIDGIKIYYSSGLYTSYFEYQADAAAVIHYISQLPFPIHSPLADTACRPVKFELMEMQRNQISSVERETMENFWLIDQENFDLYECVKGSFRHTLQIGKNANQILHRIEFMG